MVIYRQMAQGYKFIQKERPPLFILHLGLRRDQSVVVKAYVRDGVAFHVEPDGRYTQNAGREDQFLSDKDLLLNNLQARPRNFLYSSTSAGLGDLE